MNLKKWLENIDSLIGDWCKKKLVFARPLLPSGIIGEANAHYTYLHIAPADAQTKICKRVQPTEGSSRTPLEFKNLVSNFCHRTDRNGIYFCKFIALK